MALNIGFLLELSKSTELQTPPAPKMKKRTTNLKIDELSFLAIFLQSIMLNRAGAEISRKGITTTQKNIKNSKRCSAHTTRGEISP
jgi:hypothetical protein